ncbi:hypothetical protein PDJAM_G00118750 [Pangasius djambal]|uniref:Uncharacterized protein n=1 Tax=Pangasius djambal TaxID=1691987 RepID=A0ACC5ZA29_9TELE|nr:hypothetical protein [Pangasius djambal]
MKIPILLQSLQCLSVSTQISRKSSWKCASETIMTESLQIWFRSSHLKTHVRSVPTLPALDVCSIRFNSPTRHDAFFHLVLLFSLFGYLCEGGKESFSYINPLMFIKYTTSYFIL